ncbi:MAG: ATP-binding protein [Candidatus Omnitrophica bacterium]|nr:ATP-binding protein [Candidatus Omnitrophota bacterium]
MNFYALGALINAVTSIIFGLFVYFKNTKGITNRIYGLLNLTIAYWSLGYFFWQISTDQNTAFFWVRILTIGSVYIPIFYLHFILALLNLHKKKKTILLFGYVISNILAVLTYFTHLLVKDLTPKLIFKLWPNPGPIYPIFLLFFFICVIYSCYLLITIYPISTGYKRNQIRYVLFGSIFGFLAGATNYPLWYNLKILPIGNPLASIHLVIFAYAAFRYRLMDITVALTRTSIFVLVYTLILGLPFIVASWLRVWLIDILGTNWWIAPLGLMAALATVGPFIYIYVERKAEERLLREQRRYQETLKQASVGMTRIRNLHRLLDLITHIVTKTVRISYAAIYLYDAQTDKFVLQVSRDKGRVSLPAVDSDNVLIDYVIKNREPLVFEEVKRQMEDTHNQEYSKLEEEMRQLTASVVIPSFLEDKFMGFIVLGDKISGQIYTPEDLNVFQVLASQAALAIENAQFYDEAKEMQEQIAQAEKMATVGTMADGLSHQINNRFYALSLIAGDTIDTIKLTDTSTCSGEIQDMIKSISRALERIQANVMQGGEVVKGILKYTRKGEENFEDLTLDQILDGTLDMVQYKVKLSEIDIIRDYPKELPKIKGNLIQLQEAFFNFIDNAYDSTVERRDGLKENGYRGNIKISAVPKDSMLEIIIQDNGMGVKDENIKKIFTPFFTTKISARKGTGLGLYVIRRIITDMHKGKINFESKHQQGTRFILELPIAK